MGTREFDLIIRAFGGGKISIKNRSGCFLIKKTIRLRCVRDYRCHWASIEEGQTYEVTVCDMNFRYPGSVYIQGKGDFWWPLNCFEFDLAQAEVQDVA